MTVFMVQKLRLFEDNYIRLGYGEQGQLQAGGQGEGTGGAAEERSVEGRESHRQAGSHSAGGQHQTPQLVSNNKVESCKNNV